MDTSRVKSQDPANFAKTLQALLLAALAPSNLEPFLKKILEILSDPGGLGRKSAIAITVKCPKGNSLAVFRRTAAAEKHGIVSGRRNAYGVGRGLCFSAEIKPSGCGPGRILARLDRKARDQEGMKRLVETAAGILAARICEEKRDAELAFERDLSSSVKHVEELYLSYPGISIEEISRAVLDEARRMTGSTFGFAGHLDAAGSLSIPTLTREAGGREGRQPVVFNKFTGLWGWVLKRKKPLLTNKARSDLRAGGLPAGHIRIERFLGVPALSGRKLLGILALANPSGDYGPADLDAAQKLARVYAMILQRKLAEDRRRAEDEKFRAIIASSKDIIYTEDLRGRITYISSRAEDYGYAPDDLIGRSGLELSHPEDRDFLVKAFGNAMKTGRTLPILPYRLRKKDGTYFYAEQKSGVVFENGRPAYLTGVIRDVTEQRKIEDALKESEALMRRVFDTASDVIFIKDMNGMFLKVNKACADLLGTTPEAMIGRTDADFFPPETAAEIFRTDSEVVRTGKTLSLNTHHPFPGGSRHVNIIKAPLKGIKGETIGLLGIARDITELKRMETQLALARASEAVSEVARPIAHDFNNALAAINGYATLIDDDLPASSPIKTAFLEDNRGGRPSGGTDLPVPGLRARPQDQRRREIKV